MVTVFTAVVFVVVVVVLTVYQNPGPNHDNHGPRSILTPVNSELTEVNVESTRDKHGQFPVQYTILWKHLYLTILI